MEAHSPLIWDLCVPGDPQLHASARQTHASIWEKGGWRVTPSNLFPPVSVPPRCALSRVTTTGINQLHTEADYATRTLSVHFVATRTPTPLVSLLSSAKFQPSIYARCINCVAGGILLSFRFLILHDKGAFEQSLQLGTKSLQIPPETL